VKRLKPAHAQVFIVDAALMALIAFGLTGCGALVTSQPSLSAHGSTSVTLPYPTVTTAMLVYRDPLMGPTAGWAHAPECTFTPDGLAVKPNGGQAYICLAPTVPLGDMAVSVTVQQVSGAETHAYGIAFRHNEPKSYYFFGIDSHGRFTLTIVVNDVSHTVMPFAASPAIHTGIGATNELEVIAQGRIITLLVNRAAVGQATMSTFASGTVGLRGINDGVVLVRQLVIARV
jgi:hypothetical protein